MLGYYQNYYRLGSFYYFTWFVGLVPKSYFLFIVSCFLWKSYFLLFLKALGLESKEYLKKALKDAKSVVIKTEKMDSSEKYGRILGWVYVDGNTVSLNDIMINDGYAWGYLGDTKIKDFNELAKARKKSGK